MHHISLSYFLPGLLHSTRMLLWVWHSSISNWLYLTYLQICRVEDLLVNGIIKGSIIHIHRARTVTIDADGMITASELGNREYNQQC